MVTVWTFSRVIAGGKVRHVMKIIPGNKEKSEGQTQVFGNDVDGNPNESTGKVKVWKWKRTLSKGLPGMELIATVLWGIMSDHRNGRVRCRSGGDHATSRKVMMLDLQPVFWGKLQRIQCWL